MKRLDFTTIILIILVTLAMSCIALAFRPVILKMEKQQEIDQELEKFQETTEAIQLEMENTPVPSPEATAVPEIVPYSDLYTDILRYNLHLFSSRQAELNSKSAYEHSSFVLTDYGLPDEIFGVITIPKIDRSAGADDITVAFSAEFSNLTAHGIAFSSVSMFSESWYALMNAKSPRRTVERTTTLQMKRNRILRENRFINGSPRKKRYFRGYYNVSVQILSIDKI